MELWVRVSSISNGLEYGRIQLSDDAERINLYGILVGSGKNHRMGLGLIMLLDNSQQNPLKTCIFSSRVRRFSQTDCDEYHSGAIMELKHQARD